MPTNPVPIDYGSLHPIFLRAQFDSTNCKDILMQLL
jgi:hypothetical protein